MAYKPQFLKFHTQLGEITLHTTHFKDQADVSRKIAASMVAKPRYDQHWFFENIQLLLIHSLTSRPDSTVTVRYPSELVLLRLTTCLAAFEQAEPLEDHLALKDFTRFSLVSSEIVWSNGILGFLPFPTQRKIYQKLLDHFHDLQQFYQNLQLRFPDPADESIKAVLSDKFHGYRESCHLFMGGS